MTFSLVEEVFSQAIPNLFTARIVTSTGCVMGAGAYIPIPFRAHPTASIKLAKRNRRMPLRRYSVPGHSGSFRLIPSIAFNIFVQQNLP